MKKLKNLLTVALFVFIFAVSISTNGAIPVELSKINDQIWVHTSYQIYNGSLTSSNGLIVVTKKGLVMIDTCWDNDATKDLIKIAKEKFRQNFVLALITHGAHADRIGGIDVLLKAEIEVIGTKLTAQKAGAAGYKEPFSKLDTVTDLEIGGVKIETYYPGEGHTQDNIVVWFPVMKILFAGCIVKSLDTQNLGNVADGNVKEWPGSLKNILKKYPDIAIIIPGHGNGGDIDLIKHTLELF